MLDISLKVLFVIVALTMIVMILMQQGAGAAAGSGFGGGGASSTVFGSRGSSNFLSKSTRNLAIAFFALSLFMAWKASHENKLPTTSAGVISAEQEALKVPVSEVPQAPSLLPSSEKTGVTVPTPSVPAAPAATAPVAPAASENKEAAKPVEQGSK